MDLGTLWVKIAGDAKQLQTTLTQTKTRITGFGANTVKIAKENEESLNRVGIAATAMGAAITAGMVLAVKRFADFEQGMKNVQAVSNATGEELEALTAKAKQIGVDTALSATQASQALYSLASAGLAAEEQIEALDAVTTLALATQSDLGASSELIVKSLKAFKIPTEEAGRVADVFANGIANSLLNMQRLTAAMPFAATAMSGFGFDIETTSGALAVLVNNGLEASMAGTGLRRMLVSLAKPSKEAATTLEDYGIALDQVTPQTNSFVDIVNTLREANIKTSDAFKIFGQRSEAARILMKTSVGTLEQMIEKMDKTGTATRMMERQMDSLSGALTMMKSSLEAVQIVIGENLAPLIGKLADTVRTLLNVFSNAPESIQEASVSLALAAGLITTLTGVSVILIAQLPKLIAGFKALQAIAVSAGSSLAAVSVAGGALTIMIGSLVFAAIRITKAYKDWKDGTHAIARVTQDLRNEQGVLRQGIITLEQAMYNGLEAIKDNEVGMKVLTEFYRDEATGAFVQVAGALEVYKKRLDAVNKSLEDNTDKLKLEQQQIDAILANYDLLVANEEKVTQDALEKRIEYLDSVLKLLDQEGGAYEKIAKLRTDLFTEQGEFEQKTWEDAKAQFDDWVSVTSIGYSASIQDRIGYIDNLLSSVDKESKAFVGLNNVRMDLVKNLAAEIKTQADAETKIAQDRQGAIDNQVKRELAAIEISQNGYKARQKSLRDLMDTEGISQEQLQKLQDARQKWYLEDRIRLKDLQDKRDKETEKAAERLRKELERIDKESKAALEAIAKENRSDEDQELKRQELERGRLAAIQAHKQAEANIISESEEGINRLKVEVRKADLKGLQQYHDSRALTLQEDFDLQMEYLDDLLDAAKRQGEDYTTILQEQSELRRDFQRASFAEERQVFVNHLEATVGSFADAFDAIRSEAVGLESTWGATVIETLTDTIATSANVKAAIDEMADTFNSLGAHLKNNAGILGDVGNTLTGLGSTLMGIAPQVGIAVAAFQTLWAIGKAISEAFTETNTVIRTALQESLKEVNETFRERLKTAQRLKVDMVKIEEEHRRTIIAEIEKTGLDILRLTQEQNDALAKEIRSYGVTVRDLQRQASLDAAIELAKKKKDEEQSLRERIAEIDSFYEKQSNIVRRAGGDVQKLEEQQNQARINALGEFNIDLFDELGNGYDRAREIAQQSGIDLELIEAAQLQARHDLRAEFATDFDVENERHNKELRILEEHLTEINEKYADQLQVVKQFGLDEGKLNEERSREILAILERQGVDLTDAYDTQYRDYIVLAQDFGLQMKHVNEVMNEELVRIQEQFSTDRFEIYSKDLALQFETTKFWFEEQLGVLSTHNIDVTKLQQERIDRAAKQLEDAGVNVLNLTEQTEEEVLSLLARAGLNREALEKIQNDAVLKLREDYGKIRIDETGEILQQELELEQKHRESILDIVTTGSDQLTDILSQGELNRIELLQNEEVERATAERNRRLAYLYEGRNVELSRNDAHFRKNELTIEQDYRDRLIEIEKESTRDRVTLVDEVSQTIIKIEEDRAQRVADILLRSAQDQEMMNQRMKDSLTDLGEAYGEVTERIRSNDRATRELIQTYQAAQVEVIALENELAGNSLTSAFEEVESSIGSASQQLSVWNNMMLTAIERTQKFERIAVKNEMALSAPNLAGRPVFAGESVDVGDIGNIVRTPVRDRASPNTQTDNQTTQSGGIAAPIIVQVDKFFGTESEMQNLSDEITRLQRQQGVLG